MPQPPSAEAERRRAQRFPLRVKVHLEFQDLRCLLSGFALSLSPSGMFVECDDPKPVGSRFEAEFRLAGQEQWIRAEGRVVWVQPASEGIPKGMGLRFHWIDPDGMTRVADLSARHARGGGLGLSDRLAALVDGEGDEGPGPGPSDAADDLDDTVSLPPEAEDGEEPTEQLVLEPESRGPLEDTVVTLGPDVLELPEEGALAIPKRRRWALASVGVVVVGGLAAIGLVTLRRNGGGEVAERGARSVAATPAIVASTAVGGPVPEATGSEVLPEPAPFTQVEGIEWSQEGEDTVVRIELDGELSSDRVVRLRLDDGAPREVIQLLAAVEPYEVEDLQVGTASLLKIRTGFHQTEAGSEQHIVLDLATPECQVLPVESDSGVLQLRVVPRAASSG